MEIIRRKTNIVVKTERKIVVRQSSPGEEVFLCEECDEQMIMPQTAAVLYDISTREVYRLVEEGKIHFLETDSKDIFVCSNFGDLIPSPDRLEISPKLLLD
ncbi:MAG: hypothetical protein M3209_19210 [Acidobacteriota bacterium]|nr:hypothetical protein [Acidobacteriota bacterium]